MVAAVMLVVVVVAVMKNGGAAAAHHHCPCPKGVVSDSDTHNMACNLSIGSSSGIGARWWSAPN